MWVMGQKSSLRWVLLWHECPPGYRDGSHWDLMLEREGVADERSWCAVRAKTEANPEQSVVIAADKSVKYEDVVSVMDLLKQNKVEKVGLLLKPAP